VCAVEKPISSVGCAFAGVLVVRQAQKLTLPSRANMYIPENVIGERLGLDYTSNHHDANSGVQRTDVLHELLHGLPAVRHRINKEYGLPSLHVLVVEFLRLFSMDASMIEISKGQRKKTSADIQHSERQSFVNTYITPSAHPAHQRPNRGLLLMAKVAMAGRLVSLDMWDGNLLQSNQLW
jgi:hypothetical protein